MSAKKTLCYWSVGNDFYAYMLKILVRSARQAGVTDDFHVWSDRDIPGAITHSLEKRDRADPRRNDIFPYEFKFRYLKKMLELPYDYYVFLDADTYFTRKPEHVLELLRGDSVHVHLGTTDLVKREGFVRQTWSKCPLPKLIETMRRLGVKNEKIYNINGGFFIVARDAVPNFLENIYTFWNGVKNEPNISFYDEFALCYAAHMLCPDPSTHFAGQREIFDCYPAEQLVTRAVLNNQPWEKRDWFTGITAPANPAIIHFIDPENKRALLRLAGSIPEQAEYAIEQTLWKISARLRKSSKFSGILDTLLR